MLNLGLFMMPLHPADKDVGVSYEEDRKLVFLADKLNGLNKNVFFSDVWFCYTTLMEDNNPILGDVGYKDLLL